jgi:aspartyl-tRNA synthetase
MKWRDLRCGEVRPEHVGRRLTLAGWAARRRDHGGLVFVDLRDHTGICQLVVNPELAPDVIGAAHEVRNEFVLQAEGEIVERAPENVNPELPTGAIELQVDRLEIVSRSEPLPFQIGEDVDETLRIRYRWLDLRSERMQRNLRIAAKVTSAIRRRMEELGFVDFWTPSLTRTAPEGARDFVVPVRLQPGKFFALAQSPQLYKQLSVIGGLDRYYQLATCFRDEDLRADRQFEFRQLDIELAFPQRDDVLDVLEQAIEASFEALDREPPPRPFRRLTWHEVMNRFGSDKPDLRFGMEIQDATEATRGSGFGVFGNAPAVRFITVPQAFSRAELERLEVLAKEAGAKGRRAAQGQRCPRRAPHAPQPRAAPRGRVARRVPLGARLPALRARRGDRRLDVRPPPVHGRPPGPRRADGERSGRCALAGVRPRLERVGARLGLDQDPPAGRPGARLPSASCFRRCAWAHRRTAASLWDSTG